ncbi:hypothetical protein AGMMS49545_02170 [Betaproteobacteria bacterium]|nr:hypothetical protein AGMMS49545_02170 [Betaproteobacteria bacterium]GHU43826.1 hypothetical protein AGMMS50289_10940 [Betaproteobacteria bacterium]
MNMTENKPFNTSDFSSVLYAEAHSADISPERQWELMRHKSAVIRAVIAASCVTPAEVLVKLADDPSVSVLQGIACNEHTPPEVLAVLIEDTRPWVSEYALRTWQRKTSGQQVKANWKGKAHD